MSELQQSRIREKVQQLIVARAGQLGGDALVGSVAFAWRAGRHRGGIADLERGHHLEPLCTGANRVARLAVRQVVAGGAAEVGVGVGGGDLREELGDGGVLGDVAGQVFHGAAAELGRGVRGDDRGEAG